VRTAALTLLLALAAAGPAAAAGVDVLVVGKTRVLKQQRSVPLRDVKVTANGRRCRVAGATPLAVLVRTRLTLRVRDYGSCSGSTRDAAALYVRRVGPDSARGRDGWVYKVGQKVSSRGAGDRGIRLRAGRRVTWFWCVSGANGCQRTLVAEPDARHAAPGSALRVVVRGYDDHGRGVPVEGATVRLAGAAAVTGADGVASLIVPDAPGAQRLTAEHPGMVRSFAEAVAIG
jgi:hypothetical protein